MRTTLLFDVYGTLVDPAGVAVALREDAGEAAAAIAEQWRDKQVEYAFRRALMRNYVTFRVCVEQSLRFVFERNRLPLGEARFETLMQQYDELPAFDDAAPALSLLSERFRVFAFSNGTRNDIGALLDHAGLAGFFIDVISVDAVRSFKPDPAVYAHARRASAAWAGPCWLISGNPWDLMGAQSAGLGTAWVRRSKEKLYDPWGMAPDIVTASLPELENRLPT